MSSIEVIVVSATVLSLYKGEVDPEHTQFHQHHGGVCLRHRYKCMQVKSFVR